MDVVAMKIGEPEDVIVQNDEGLIGNKSTVNVVRIPTLHIFCTINVLQEFETFCFSIFYFSTFI